MYLHWIYTHTHKKKFSWEKKMNCKIVVNNNLIDYFFVNVSAEYPHNIWLRPPSNQVPALEIPQSTLATTYSSNTLLSGRWVLH